MSERGVEVRYVGWREETSGLSWGSIYKVSEGGLPIGPRGESTGQLLTYNS